MRSFPLGLRRKVGVSPFRCVLCKPCSAFLVCASIAFPARLAGLNGDAVEVVGVPDEWTLEVAIDSTGLPPYAGGGVVTEVISPTPFSYQAGGFFFFFRCVCLSQ